MEKMIAYCGLVCTDCGAYIATLKNDSKMRKEIAEDWTKKYNHTFKVEDIDCDGCLMTTPKKIGHLNICTIRKCGQVKGVKNCAYCDDYSCNKTDEFLKFVPEAKKTLDAIKQGMH